MHAWLPVGIIGNCHSKKIWCNVGKITYQRRCDFWSLTNTYEIVWGMWTDSQIMHGHTISKSIILFHVSFYLIWVWLMVSIFPVKMESGSKQGVLRLLITKVTCSRITMETNSLSSPDRPAPLFAFLWRIMKCVTTWEYQVITSVWSL